MVAPEVHDREMDEALHVRALASAFLANTFALDGRGAKVGRLKDRSEYRFPRTRGIEKEICEMLTTFDAAGGQDGTCRCGMMKTPDQVRLSGSLAPWQSEDVVPMTPCAPPFD